ncbi:protein-tyrosine-phosphatase [bacterium]|nr:protein-tyrosine-phosphatase [bacterium]
MSDKPHVLFVCGRNRWRSPTAVRIYAHDQRFDARSAGVSPKSRRLISRHDIEWADLILVMEQRHAARLRDSFRDVKLPKIESLDIPDDFEFMNAELVERIQAGTEIYLEQIFGIEPEI